MAKLSEASIKKLATCDSQLQMVMKEAIKLIDFSVLYGFRTIAEQDELFKKGVSKLKGGQSKHNSFPSLAVDIAPYPIDFSEKELSKARFYFLAGNVIAIGKRLGVNLRWGGDWDGDVDFSDQTFHDLGHFELMP